MQSWSPGGREVGDLARVKATRADLYQADPVLGPALASGLQTEAQAAMLTSGQPQERDVRGVAVTAGKFLGAEGGPSVAVLSLEGFDTHAGQGAVNGLLATRLTALDNAVAGLKEGLGASWSQTAVIAVTEFGRTAHINATFGTLTVGRQNAFTNDLAGQYDPFGGSYAFSLIGNSSTFVAGAGDTELSQYNMSVKYHMWTAPSSQVLISIG